MPPESVSYSVYRWRELLDTPRSRQSNEPEHLGCVFGKDNYNRYRTHLSLDMDSPEGRPPQESCYGRVTAVPHLGGLHHHYERQAA